MAAEKTYKWYIVAEQLNPDEWIQILPLDADGGDEALGYDSKKEAVELMEETAGENPERAGHFMVFEETRRVVARA